MARGNHNIPAQSIVLKRGQRNGDIEEFRIEVVISYSEVTHSAEVMMVNNQQVVNAI